MVTYLEYTTLNDFRKGTFRTVWGGPDSRRNSGNTYQIAGMKHFPQPRAHTTTNGC